jgi:RluA family pseudouridine synthase
MMDKLPLEEHIVPDSTLESIRLQNYCYDRFECLPTHKSVVKAIVKGLVKVNDTVGTTGLFVKPGDRITIYREEKKGAILKLNLEVLWEDDYLAVVHKPPGIPTSGNKFRTVENALPYNLKMEEQDLLFYRPRPVHRLDASTGGLLLVAKDPDTERKLRSNFELGEINKEYRAIVRGKLQGGGNWVATIDNRDAESKYEAIYSWCHNYLGELTYLRLHPITGRTHQLRIHCAMAGHPVLGDKIYGGIHDKLKRGLYLAACKLEFEHPITGELLKVLLSVKGKFRKILSSYYHSLEK